ncbi:MAG TPA: hypothetical protein VEW46_24240 [Pyrinomonadaceae bacterium]|nr:hypothetical protein [Pyrinomonadaceae bacterium]
MFATNRKNALVLSLILGMLISAPVLAQKNENEPKAAGVPVIWLEPGDISKRDLRYGPGSASWRRLLLSLTWRKRVRASRRSFA